MSSFVPTNYDLRTALVFCYHLKKTAAELHRMLVEAYGEHALGKKQCFEWFKTFKSGKFDVRNEDRGKLPKKFKEATNCKPYWMKTILKLNKNSHIN